MFIRDTYSFPMNRVKKCLMCMHCTPAILLANVDELNKHIFQSHGHLPAYICGGCKRSYSHKTSLIRHISEKHDLLDLGNETLDQPSSSQVHCDVQMQQIEEDNQQVEEDDHCDIEQCGSPVPAALRESVQMVSARFLLDLRSSGNITGASISLIQIYVTKLIKAILSVAEDKTRMFIEANGIDANAAAIFLKETFLIDEPFKDLNSTQDQLKFYSENFGLVKPQEMYLDSRIENRFDRKLRAFVPTQVPETFQYVSVVQTLRLVVRNSYLRQLILSESPSEDGVIRNFKDGLDFKTNAFLQKYPGAIRLVLYYDDLETAGALGSKDVIHKLGCFYISILNFPPEESSRLSSIYLEALTYAEDLKKDGAIAKVLVPFLEELKRLQSDEGVEIDLPEGGTFTLRACLVGLCGDSLAAHALLGFMSPSANLFCRLCTLTKTDFARDSTAVGTIRSTRLHEKQVKKVERNSTLGPSYGIKERTPLAAAMRVPEDSIFDIFHDLLGVTQMILKLAFHEYVLVKKLLSVAELNENISVFVYGKPDNKNKPSPNFTAMRLSSSGHTLKQSASQTFCLLGVFPFLFSGIEEGDQILELVFLLQDIAKIMFSFEVRSSDIDRLETLIEKHNGLFHELFIPAPSLQEATNDESSADESDDSNTEEEAPTRSSRGRAVQRKKLKKGINKLHHLTHYPKQFREKGPMIRLWCALFEIRHRLVRKHSAVVQNFKNIPKTMATVFQLSTLGSILERSGPAENKCSTTGAEICLVLNSPYHQILLHQGFQENDQVQTVKSAELCGEEYQVGLFVALKSLGAQPMFGLIIDVLVEIGKDSRVFLVVQECENQGLSASYNSYKVLLSQNEPILVTVKELANYRPIAPWSPVKSDGPLSLFLHPRTVFMH